MNSVLLLFIAALAAANATSLTQNLDPRIVNGQDVKSGEIPFQVSLQKNGRHFCGGSVLNANYILTAAHCVVDQGTNIEVVVGTVNLQVRPAVYQATKIIVHEKYTPSNNWMNDIALIRVNKEIAKGPQVSYVPLPSANEPVRAGAEAIVSGWGRLRLNGPTTDKLQKARIFITDQTTCKNVYHTIFDSQICANDPQTEKGACNGDSGGPLTVNGKIVGIVSWSRGCALSKYPTVYTRVTSFLDWIRQHAV
ncbi:chymotrypsin-2-like [Xylocopa sonorina]|uniref:chymotrypsin-2-like n=1 Tax=Xylocopa sonorina TaxID=1818115 RepID=UPI00403A83A7